LRFQRGSEIFLAAPIKPLVSLTALAAFLAVAVTRYGDALRTLGNWVFIPAVYLAREVREGSGAAEAPRHAGIIVAASPIALLLVCCVQMVDGRHRDDAVPPTYGSASVDWLLPAAATALAVFAAAALVEVLNLAQGQWVMWSAASVVVGDLSAVTGKLKLRAAGAFIGVPLGFLVGIALPESRAGYSFAALGTLGTTLTLIAFSRYAVGFGTRCFFIALAASFRGRSKWNSGRARRQCHHWRRVRPRCGGFDGVCLAKCRRRKDRLVAVGRELIVGPKIMASIFPKNDCRRGIPHPIKSRLRHRLQRRQQTALM
jgi:hypothetical protein